MFRDIKELCPTPYDAIFAMVKGLKKYSKRKRFLIDMTTFGRLSLMNNKKVCFGCAASCAIQEISKTSFKPNKLYSLDLHTRAQITNFDAKQLRDFEDALDIARMGQLDILFHFYNLDSFHRIDYDNEFRLVNDNWESQLPAVIKIAKQIKKDMTRKEQ